MLFGSRDKELYRLNEVGHSAEIDLIHLLLQLKISVRAY